MQNYKNTSANVELHQRLSGGQTASLTTMSQSSNGTNTAGGMAGGSTTSIGRASMQPFNLASVNRNELQESDNDDVILGTNIPSVRKEKGGYIQGSGQRKRSRVHEEEVGDTFVKKGLSNKDSQAQKIQLDVILQHLYAQIEAVFTKGERGKTIVNKLAIFDTLRTMGMDLHRILTAYANLQDEKSALQLLSRNSGIGVPTVTTGTPATNTYLQAAMMKNVASNINVGRRLPIPEIPNSLKHAPSKKVLIFKAEKKGVQLTKAQKEQFKMDVNRAIGEKLMEEVDVIRPTRNGGHTIIFHTEESRGKALEALRQNERNMQIEEKRSCIKSA